MTSIDHRQEILKLTFRTLVYLDRANQGIADWLWFLNRKIEPCHWWKYGNKAFDDVVGLRVSQNRNICQGKNPDNGLEKGNRLKPRITFGYLVLTCKW